MMSHNEEGWGRAKWDGYGIMVKAYPKGLPLMSSGIK